MASYENTYAWVDDNGYTSNTSIHIATADGTLADVSRTAFRDALIACSGAQMYEENIILGQTVDENEAATDEDFNVKDKAILVFQTAVRSVVRLSIPAPLATIFLNDEVVDAADSLISALLTASFATLTDISGNLVTTFLGGKRIKT